MAFLETFDSYPNGSTLEGKNGGSGWSNAWSMTTDDGSYTISTTQNVSVPNSVVFGAGVSGNRMVRTLSSAPSAGTCYFSCWSSGVTSNNKAFMLHATHGGSDTIIVFLNINSDSKWSIYNGSSFITLGNGNDSTWHRIGIEWDNAGHANQARYNYDGGAFTSWFNVSGGAFSSISDVALYNPSNTGTLYIDNISDSYDVITNTAHRPLLGVGQ